MCKTLRFYGFNTSNRETKAEEEAAWSEIAKVTGKCNGITISHFINHMFSLQGRK